MNEWTRWFLEQLRREEELDRRRRFNFWKGVALLLAVLIASILTLKKYL